MRNILNRILRPQKSTTTLSARILLNVILHKSKFQSLEKYYRFKNEYSFLGEGKISHEKTQKLTFFSNKYFVFREEQ